jgi:hypothetical protein
MIAPIVMLAAALSVLAESNPREELTEAKLAVDLGNEKEADRILSSLASRPEVPVDVACEALVRLAALQREVDRGASAASMRAVMERCAGDEEARRLLVEVVTGVEQDPRTWRGLTESFELGFVEAADGPDPTIAYVSDATRDPFLAATGRSAAGAWHGEPVSIDVKDADVVDLMRLFHDLSGLNFILDPGVRGMSITMGVRDMPWDQLLVRILESKGLGASVHGKIVRIAPLAVLRGERFTGSAEDRKAQERTLAIIEYMATVRLVAIRDAVGRWPVATEVADLMSVLRAGYMKDGKAQDAWGHELRYWSDGTLMRVVSGGKDGMLDHPDLAGYVPGVAHRPEDDLAWEGDHALTFLVTPGPGDATLAVVPE